MSVISAQISRWCSAVAHWGRRCLCPPLLKGPGQSERAGAWQAAATGSFVSILGVRPTIISPPRGCGHGSRRWTFTKKIVLTKTDRSENSVLYTNVLFCHYVLCCQQVCLIMRTLNWSYQWTMWKITAYRRVSALMANNDNSSKSYRIKKCLMVLVPCL